MKREPPSAACHRDFMRAPLDGYRSTKKIRLLTIHSTESSASAREIAEFFHGTPKGYAHLTLDDYSCYRSLTNSAVPRAAPGINSSGFHVEFCGRAAWTRAQWMKHKPMLERGAYKFSIHAALFELPVVFVDAAGIKAGRKGITTHHEASKAYTPGGHWDPGDGFPLHYFLDLVRDFTNV